MLAAHQTRQVGLPLYLPPAAAGQWTTAMACRLSCQSAVPLFLLLLPLTKAANMSVMAVAAKSGTTQCFQTQREMVCPAGLPATPFFSAPEPELETKAEAVCGGRYCIPPDYNKIEPPFSREQPLQVQIHIDKVSPAREREGATAPVPARSAS